MSMKAAETVLAPTAVRPRLAPLWHVVLLDDDDHTYEYVIEMLCTIFRLDPRAAYAMACEVDRTGRVIVHTGLLEQAEFKREQIHGFGADPRLKRSQGAMTAVLEPAPV